MKGTPTQVLTMMAAVFCQNGSLSQAGVGRWAHSRAMLRTPPSSARISRQAKTVTKVGTAHGRIRTIR